MSGLAPNATLLEQTEHFLKVERFNPPEDLLEAFVDEQCAQGTYHLRANLALLKQYQFKPERRDIGYCAKILILALSRPQDFLSYMYLLPESVQCTEPVSTLSRLSTLLEACQFPEFWDSVRTEGQNVALLKEVPQFAAGVRAHIARVLSATYQNVPLNIVVESMRFGNDKEMDSFFGAQKWVRDGDVVTVPENAENTTKQLKFKEQMAFAQLAPMLANLTH